MSLLLPAGTIFQKYIHAMHYQNLIDTVFQVFGRVPGSSILTRYIQTSYQHDPVRSVIELCLVIFFVRYLLAPAYPTHSANYVKLSENEIDELVDEWEPEPLVALPTQLEEAEAARVSVIVGPSGPKVKLSTGKTITNLASYNFYNLNANEQIREKAIEALRTYGVGPCGPPLFYGTQDVHMNTELEIATFLGTEACILYAQAFSTISSLIPAFCKRGDIIIADKQANYSIRQGLDISRSHVKWFNHNDMEDLERVMTRVIQEQKGRKLTRRFIVAEGLSELVGDCVDLVKLVELKEKYKFRVILDETWSFGVLGRTGRGITEAQNVDRSKIDMIVGSLAGPLCAGGGFCCGTREIIHHQRLSAAAYTYSAALPAILAVTATQSLNFLQTNPEVLTHCRQNIKAMRAQLDFRSDWVICTSSPENPVILLVLKANVVQARHLNYDDQERLLQECVDEALSNGILITRLRSLLVNKSVENTKDEKSNIRAALKLCITSGLSAKDIEKAGTVIRHAITKVMTRKLNI